MLTAWLAGLVMGFAGSVPVAGPINMLVFSFGLQGRLRSATLIALGGALPEAIWAGLAFWGFTALLERYDWIEAGSEIAATVVLVCVGLFLLLRPPTGKKSSEAERDDVSGTLSALGLGFSLTALNPTLLFNWGAAVTMVVSLGILLPQAALAIPFAVGVLMGILLWFAVILQLLARHHRRFSPESRAWMLRGMGLLLLAFALATGARLFWTSGQAI